MSRTLLRHDRIWTGDAESPWTDALLVEDGRITAVGCSGRRSGGRPGRRRPARAPSSCPACTTPTSTPSGWLASLSSVDLHEARSLDETLELVRAHAESLPAGEWLHSGRWNHNIWDVPVQPDRHSLDTVSGDRVAALSSVDGHTIWANSVALQRAGITRDTPDPVGGEIVRDADGEPTGILRESAQELLDVIEQDQAPLRPWLERAQELLLSVGLTSITDIDGEEARAAYAEMHADGALRLRVTKCTRDGDLELAIAEGRRSGQGDDRFRVGPVKFFSDGALGSHTAHMTEPFIGHEGCGIAAMPYEVLLERTLLAVRSGLDVCTHAIGDEANRLVLDSFEAVRAEGHDAAAAHRARPARAAGRHPAVPLARRHRLDAAQPLHGRPRARRPDHRPAPARVVCVAQLPRRRGAAGLRVRRARRGPEPLLRSARSRDPAARRRVTRSAGGGPRSGSPSTRPCAPTPSGRTRPSGAPTSAGSPAASSPTSSSSTATSGRSRGRRRPRSATRWCSRPGSAASSPTSAPDPPGIRRLRRARSPTRRPDSRNRFTGLAAHPRLGTTGL